MDHAYEQWISANVSESYGACKEVTTAMAQAFPELRRVRGHYQDALWGKRSHWWLVTPDGSIVDPTASQFPTRGHGEYVEWTEGAKEPVGKCPNCGEYSYNPGGCCSDDCGREYAAYLMRGICEV